MHTGSSLRNWISGVGCCLVVFAILAVPAGALAAPRVVMCEDVMTTWCVYCPAVSTELATIMDANPTQFTFFQIHGSGESPNYEIPWGQTRESYYGVTGYPTTVQDGIFRRVGQYPAGTYTSDFNARKNVATDVSIRVGGGQISSQTYNLTAWVSLDAGGVAKTVRVYIIEALDHYPAGGTHYRDCLRQVGMHGTTPYQDVALTPGQTQTVQVTMIAGDDWTNRTNMKIIAWAQKTGAFSTGSEVHNAGFMNWPFMNDCNSNGIPDEQDIANGTSQDCNDNLVPDECDIANCHGDPACGDCNGNGIPDVCDGFISHVDCDQNGLYDECELLVHPELDCNANGIVDQCDINSGVSLDCNANHVPDECDRTNCNGAPWCSDCNHNGVLDYCDLHINFAAQSPQYSPFGAPTTATYALTNPPYADGTVTLVFTILGDINFSNESVSADLNGTVIAATLYNVGNEVDCAATAQTVSVTPAVYNAALAAGGGNMNINMVPSAGVNPAQCGSTQTYIQVAVSYIGVPPSADANQNGIPDECEQSPSVCHGDADCDGQVSFSDIDLFVASIPDDQATWAQLYADRHGGAQPPCTFANCDVTGDGHVLFDDIDAFVALIPSACP